jgi:hypothetical protein
LFRKRVMGIKYIDGYVPCNRTMTFDHRAPWPLMLAGVIQPILQAALFLALSISGWTNRRASLGGIVTVICLILLALVAALSGIGYALLQLPTESIVPLLSSVCYLAVASSISLFPSRLVHTIAASTSALLLIRVAIDCALFQDPANLAADPPYPLLLCLVSSGAILATRRRRAALARRDARPDRALFDSAWHAAAASAGSDGFAPALARLAAAAECARRACPDERPRQLNRRRLAMNSEDGTTACEFDDDENFIVRRGSGGDDLEDGESALWRPSDPACGTAAGEPDPSSPVTSLDQLYAQAFAASVLLRDRCQLWAASTGGRMEDCPPASPLPSAAAPVGSVDRDGNQPSPPGDEAAAATRRAPTFKSPHRAAEKAATCYGGDVSLLLDVCRCRWGSRAWGEGRQKEAAGMWGSTEALGNFANNTPKPPTPQPARGWCADGALRLPSAGSF